MVDLKNQALPRALSDVVADLADLFQKELRLAKAELSEKLSIKAWAGVWMAAAAFFALLAVILIVQAAGNEVPSFRRPRSVPRHTPCALTIDAMSWRTRSMPRSIRSVKLSATSSRRE